MLQDLPIEVIQQIIGHLSTASSIVNLSLTNRKIHAIISADDYGCFRAFVQKAFPSIKTPPLWRDSARALTSRSRAWDRRAFIARECHPPLDQADPPHNFTATVGYHPVIDSYEIWPGSTWFSRKEVLAWGAAGRLRVRILQNGVATWGSFLVPDDHRQELDILDVKLLQPHQHDSKAGESIVLRRANGELIKVETCPRLDVFTEKSRYIIPQDMTCIDISRSANPMLAACGGDSIHLYPVHSLERNVRPMDRVTVQSSYSVRNRKRCVTFLSDTTLAVGVQFLQGRNRAPIIVYDISPTGLSATPLLESISFADSRHPVIGRHSANVIVPLDNWGTSTRRSGQLFLSGWTDGIVRLHDTRVPTTAVTEYVDFVDDGQILSLLPIGHERFLAGSHQNGCLKIFDLRMAGARPYSYLDARSADARRSSRSNRTTSRPGSTTPNSRNRRDINIFITPTINYGERLWQPLARRPARRSNRYRGSVYSLSSPSPSSPTVYAGIENHVLRLDFVSTYDYRRGTPGLVDPSLDLHDKTNHVLNLSCYERPREGHESTDAVLLRKQLNLTSGGRKDSAIDPHIGTSLRAEVEPGWDERWSLETFERNRGRNLDWGATRAVAG
ncbi:hypothetical protein PV11_08584 [Exophiala sideris]|uniref:F-box domain-containing protein n=1 Tax=Exophiala sideris TaxID=1016849 RepID=A0A0D1YDT6_9EURO|nr:hypothetical protein PV11_08584 [Exophiala sideris]